MVKKVDESMKAMGWFLSVDGIKEIHENTIIALQEIGITVNHDQGLSILADAGAKVDHKTQIAKIPSSIVESCLRAAPKEFIMAGQDL